MCLYLTKVGATYYFRRPVPDDLRGHFLTKSGKPRADWKFSLGTKDQTEAKRLRNMHAATIDSEIDAARADLIRAPQATTPGYVMSDREAHSIEDAEEQWKLDAGARAFEDDAIEYGEALARPRAQLTYEQRMAAWNAQHERERGDRYKSRYQRRKEREEREAAERAASPSPTPKSKLPLLWAFDRYASEQGLKPGVRTEWHASIERLIAFLGHDDASRITVEDLDRWRDSLIGAETNRGKPRTARTVRGNYINPLRATLNYAIEKRWLKENVASKVVVRVPKQARLRDRDFTPDEVKAILAATTRAPDWRITPGQALARRWIPWLCAYTGARVNELSQLRREDVKQVDGVWCITITPEAGTVKANAARTVPLHPHLIEQGFPKAIEARPTGPLFYDPAKQRKEDSTRHFKKVGERLAAWIRDGVGITDPNVQPNHGWRHLFKTRAMEAQVQERVADAIQGHAPKSVGQTYGSVSVKIMKDAIDRMPRFDIKPD